MQVLINGEWQEMRFKRQYRITKVNGVVEVYYVSGVMNSALGNAALRLKHANGFHLYIPIRDIKKLDIIH